MNMDIDVPMPIVTPRLILRGADIADAAALHEAKAETWDMLHRWMPWAKELGTIADDEEVIRESQEKFAARTDFMMFGFEKATGRFVIGTGLHRFDWAVRRFEIGYWVRKSAQGNGYAGEAANALTRYAFAVFAAKAVAISYADGNDKSRRVAEKLNLTFEGTMPKSLPLPNGTPADQHWYSCASPHGLPKLAVRWG